MPESPWSGRSRESTARKKLLVATWKRGWSRFVLNTQGRNAGHLPLPLSERSASRLEDRCAAVVYLRAWACGTAAPELSRATTGGWMRLCTDLLCFGTSPLRDSGRVLAPTPTGDYWPRASMVGSEGNGGLRRDSFGEYRRPTWFNKNPPMNRLQVKTAAQDRYLAESGFSVFLKITRIRITRPQLRYKLRPCDTLRFATLFRKSMSLVGSPGIEIQL